ncbi:hypothetical protein WVIC16_50039 [Weissella viridescens]|nr:hypothetical protein WVIC16_50039 [Weissella viridescens]
MAQSYEMFECKTLLLLFTTNNRMIIELPKFWRYVILAQVYFKMQMVFKN